MCCQKYDFATQQHLKLKILKGHQNENVDPEVSYSFFSSSSVLEEIIAIISLCTHCTPSQTFMSARVDSSRVDSARDSARESARESARASARGSARNGPESSRSVQSSARSIAMSGRSDIPESSRDTMSTARVQTALAALAAERSVLENRLSTIDSLLEQETKKSFMKPRGRK